VVWENQLGTIAKYTTTCKSGENPFYIIFLSHSSCLLCHDTWGLDPILRNPPFNRVAKFPNSFNFFLQIVPPPSSVETSSSKHLKESQSLHLEDQVLTGLSNASTPGTRSEATGADGADLFGAFCSVTLHYDGET
jgi:hypothetical protein